ncbi:6016_t:CDS:2 [Cetraspora pellucida]|uniref:6016_t:CDS:1 n=1 Tax=Cetraspora pellucida TaxID=1433469 RepID=A0A9N9DDE7_9GLOM|nr:6016_t:CDS:2 [Cetraspora pellucida]
MDEEQNDIAPSFTELGMEEYDETNDIIRQNVQELWEFWQKKECTCRKSKTKKKTCYEKIGFYYFFKRQEECHDMSHNNLDTWIMGQLASFAYNKLQESDNLITDNRIKYQYRYDAHHIMCLTAYLKLTGISSCRLDRIKSHIKNNGIVEIIHGNIGRTSIRPDRVVIDNKMKQDINNYLHNYANIYGFPSPGRNMKNDVMPIISLPTDMTYTSLKPAFIAAVAPSIYNKYAVNHPVRLACLAKHLIINPIANIIILAFFLKRNKGASRPVQDLTNR